MRIIDLMKTDVVTLSPSDTVAAARGEMARQHFRHVPIVERGELVGMVSEGDLRGATREDLELRAIMTSPVASLAPNASVRQAANLLRGRKIGCVPIVEDGKLVGIVTETDLLELVSRGPAAVRDRLGRRGHGSPSVAAARSRGIRRGP